jgi:hypothetical protein
MNIAKIAALLALAGSATMAQAAQPRLGVQLWSVKDEIKQDFEGTLSRLASSASRAWNSPANSGRTRTTRPA